MTHTMLHANNNKQIKFFHMLFSILLLIFLLIGILKIIAVKSIMIIFGDKYQLSVKPAACPPIPNKRFTYCIPTVKLLHLKKTHPTATASIVYKCFTTFGTYILQCLRKNFSNIRNAPCQIPQNTKCQLAPCHNPVAKNNC